jgi:hypothetical protein
MIGTAMRASDVAAIGADEPVPPGKLLVSIDGTSSRLPGWETSRALHARMIEMLPERHAAALAAYHDDIDTFTPFLRNRRRLCRLAARIDCWGGTERLAEVLARAAKIRGLAASINVTDESACCLPAAAGHAERLRKRGVPVFILLDPHGGRTGATPDLFAQIAALTGGAVLPFTDSGLRELLRLLEEQRLVVCTDPYYAAGRSRGHGRTGIVAAALGIAAATGLLWWLS